MRQRAVLAAAAVWWCAVLTAQPQQDPVSVRGEVHTDLPEFFYRYRAELTDRQHHEFPAFAWLDSDGGFQFRNIAPGDYQLSIVTPEGVTVHESLVSIYAASGPLVVRLATRERERPAAGPVSVRQLLHPPSRKAVQLAAAAQKFSEAGQFAKAAAELEKAVHDSPDFAEAYVNLAVQHIRLQRYQEALAELEQAQKIGGPSALLLCNRSVAEAALGRKREALESARASLRLEPDFRPAMLMVQRLTR